ncbi:MAG: hypothetical protein WC307_01155 [Candidatus Nanoarchaeia archaeon]
MVAKKRKRDKKLILILISIIGISLVVILGVFWYPSLITEQRINQILASNVTVDSVVIEDLRIREWTPVIVRLHNQEGFTFDEIEDMVLSALTDNEFRLKSKFSSSNAFAGYVTIKGLENLVKISQVRKIVTDYANISASDTGISGSII